MPSKCYFAHCRSVKDLHCFPSDKTVFKMWQDIVNVSFPISKRRNYYICSKHFEDDCKFPGRKYLKLKPNAVPTLFLEPETDDNIFYCTTLSPQKDLPSTSQNVGHSVDEDEVFLETAEPIPGPSGTSKRRIISDLEFSVPQTPTTPSPKRRTLNSIDDIELFLQQYPDDIAIQDLNKQAESEQNLQAALAQAVKIAKDFKEKHEDTNILLQDALKYAEDYGPLCNKLNNESINFVRSQARLQNQHLRGRRYTIDDKIMALSIMRQSPKAYKFLQNIFCLPSKKTILKELNKIPFNTGINKNIMQHLATAATKLSKEQRKCILMFDEIFLEAGLNYEVQSDNIVGCRDLGGSNGRSGNFADHALVLMARGVIQNWKQPIAFYFSDSGLKATELKNILTEAITAMQEAGYEVEAIACDQLSTNSKAIELLKEETREFCLRQNIEIRDDDCTFTINGAKIAIIFDPPHLLKGMRNNFIGNEIVYCENEEVKVADWDHIVHFYEVNKGEKLFQLARKITDEHIYPEKMRKMKVSLAAQIFSNQLGSAIGNLTKIGNAFPRNYVDTANFLIFMDCLFDSVNGRNTKHNFEGLTKKFRCAATPSSPHVDFWVYALKMLDSIYFQTDEGRQFIPPTIKNWIVTIKSFIFLRNKYDRENIEFLITRSFNQDPLENFFGAVRRQASRNPTCSSFVHSFKTLILNNILYKRSPNANCEEDGSTLLSNLKSFLINEVQEMEDITIELVYEDMDFSEGTLVRRDVTSYVAGYFAKKIIKKIKCDCCKNIVITNQPSSDHLLLNVNELTKPTSYFATIVRRAEDICCKYIEDIWYKNNLKETLKYYLMAHLNLFNACSQHDLNNFFRKEFLKCFIYAYVKNVNKHLKGIKTLNTNSQLCEKAKIRFIKYKTKKRAIDKIKNRN